MSRSVKKGPFVAFSLVKKIDAMNEANEKKIVKNLVPCFYYPAEFRRSHHCDSRRKKTRTGIHHRRYGRP